MKQPAWEKCHYYKSGQCHERTTIDKVYLTPQLLGVSQIEAATKTCQESGQYPSKKRKYRRVARPCKVVVSNKKSKKNITRTVVDVSVKGALVKLDNWLNFDKDEKVNLELSYKATAIKEEIVNVINVLAKVKKVEKEKGELAIVFLENSDEKKCQLMVDF